MTISFAIIAVVTLGAAAVAMVLRNLIHSALLLIGSWAGIAAFYLWCGAEFVAFAQVLVYVGAVSMIVLFAVLLTRRSRAEFVIADSSFRRAITAAFVGAAVLGLLAGAVVGTDLPANPAARPFVTVREIGRQLMSAHIAAVLVTGAILTVALLGAVVLAAADRNSGDRQP